MKDINNANLIDNRIITNDCISETNKHINYLNLFEIYNAKLNNLVDNNIVKNYKCISCNTLKNTLFDFINLYKLINKLLAKELFKLGNNINYSNINNNNNNKGKCKNEELYNSNANYNSSNIKKTFIKPTFTSLSINNTNLRKSNSITCLLKKNNPKYYDSFEYKYMKLINFENLDNKNNNNYKRFNEINNKSSIKNNKKLKDIIINIEKKPAYTKTLEDCYFNEDDLNKNYYIKIKDNTNYNKTNNKDNCNNIKRIKSFNAPRRLKDINNYNSEVYKNNVISHNNSIINIYNKSNNRNYSNIKPNKIIHNKIKINYQVKSSSSKALIKKNNINFKNKIKQINLNNNLSYYDNSNLLKSINKNKTNYDYKINKTLNCICYKLKNRIKANSQTNYIYYKLDSDKSNTFNNKIIIKKTLKDLKVDILAHVKKLINTTKNDILCIMFNTLDLMNEKSVIAEENIKSIWNSVALIKDSKSK